ncbi:hypothetical protein [Neorhizobium galegae]|uniref:hypothetical protein n=1 Tax=Neorhizobium galegae TaxID=399 RepID=UPI00069C2FB6
MKWSLDHRPLRKQREFGRVLEILHEEFEDALKQGTAELDDEPLAEPQPLSPADQLRVAEDHFEDRYLAAVEFADWAEYARAKQQRKRAAFAFHKVLEQAYSCVLLTLTNLRPAFALHQVPALACRGAGAASGRGVPAANGPGERTAVLLERVDSVCREHLETLQGA